MSAIRLVVESTDDGKIVVENILKKRRYEVILIPADTMPDEMKQDFARLSNAVFAEFRDKDEVAIYDKYLPGDCERKVIWGFSSFSRAFLAYFMILRAPKFPDPVIQASNLVARMTMNPGFSSSSRVVF